MTQRLRFVVVGRRVRIDTNTAKQDHKEQLNPHYIRVFILTKVNNKHCLSDNGFSQRYSGLDEVEGLPFYFIVMRMSLKGERAVKNFQSVLMGSSP